VKINEWVTYAVHLVCAGLTVVSVFAWLLCMFTRCVTATIEALFDVREALVSAYRNWETNNADGL
jgi:Na+-transporting methylmalonyl-CoA/oxaloacetate decarboxylase gamma subunit